MSTIYGIYGASGFGKEVLPLVKEQFGNKSKIVFVDDGDVPNELFGCDIFNFEQFVNLEGQKKVTIAISNSKIREKLTLKCLEKSIEVFDVKASNSVVLEDVKMGGGSILCPFVTLTSDITIGKSFQVNIYSYVAHDCVIGDYVTFAPAVKCNGNVYIGDHAYIGTGAIIHQGKPNRPLKIGKGAVIAAGAVVTKSVPDGMTVFGSPAIEFTKENIKRRS
ncbi:acetyltransferase [Malaciobacter halophilus]|uniref:Acetyltransferase n=1 Tax=Malaciobacter halophilus TaxID=197482 RepID=A0A2N1J5R1_9BACT|nr:acetyltransferase [Malaciobacter halophilus]AXH09218.1 sugar O-acyltransferase [Malaciobacter halophilus]PKI81854.1 acetyltransferase [Malaciobacter halophilus]